MKNLVALIVLVLAVPAFAQIIDRASGVDGNPAAVQVVTYQYDGLVAFSVGKTDGVDGAASTFKAKNKVLELKAINNGTTTTYQYIIYSKKGQVLSTYDIKENVYFRLTAIFAAANQDVQYSSYQSSNLLCPIMIQIDRGDYSLVKVTPTCDELM